MAVSLRSSFNKAFAATTHIVNGSAPAVLRLPSAPTPHHLSVTGSCASFSSTSVTAAASSSAAAATHAHPHSYTAYAAHKSLPAYLHVSGRPATATASAVDATPLPAFACEKSAVTQLFKQQTGNGRERAFFVNDVGVVERQHARWERNLPRVRPYYAVKCNPDPTLLRTLVSLGTGFDCASGEEMASVLAMGVQPHEIIFANPIKNAKDLKFAREQGVKKMTFDNEAELFKIKQHHPDAELVIRLLADDSGSVMKFGSKFGAPFVQVESLLKAAKQLGLKVIGTSFHIGSGCFNPNTYTSAVELSKTVFDMGVKLGMPKFTFLDLGGGFPGNPVENEATGDVPAFETFAEVIRTATDKYFPKESGVEIIGEPGRYMATAFSTLFVLVQGKREMPKSAEAVAAGDTKRKFLYYINDGVYGSFNSIMFDHAHPEPIPAYRFMEDRVSLVSRVAPQTPFISTAVPSAVVPSVFNMFAYDAASASSAASARAYHTTLGRDTNCVGTFFGPTCDSMDVVASNYPVEELFVGDWLAFAQSGAYTNAAATTFNGMAKPTVHYCRSRQPSPLADK